MVRRFTANYFKPKTNAGKRYPRMWADEDYLDSSEEIEARASSTLSETICRDCTNCSS